jgi:hypothetical protein
MSDVCTTVDLVQNRGFLAMWGLTIVLIMGQILWPESNLYLAPGLLGSWGVFCSVNAVRCGRMHCRITGPLCLLGAVTVMLMSRGVVPLSGDGFNAIFLVGIAAAFGVEAVFGKYGRGE